jgi:hypothetical protein
MRTHFLIGVLPANQSFQGGKGSFCCKSTNSAKLEKHMYLSKEIHPSVLEAEESTTYFSVKIELVFEQHTS